MASKQP